MPYILYECKKCWERHIDSKIDIVDWVCNKCVWEFIKQLMIKEWFLFIPGKDAKEITL